jgi:hypothetical protein
MPWYLAIFKLFVSCLLFCLCGSALAVDEQRLWLPVRYQTHYLDLVKAAEAAEAHDRCVTVMEGTIDLEQSRPEHAIYRILCRQESGRTYNEMVDGLTFATFTTPKVVEPELTPEQQELLGQQEEEHRMMEIARRKSDAWAVCRESLRERTRMMLELHWLVDLESAVEPVVFDDEMARFVVDFDARGMAGEALLYSAECSFIAGAAEVRLRKR